MVKNYEANSYAIEPVTPNPMCNSCSPKFFTQPICLKNHNFRIQTERFAFLDFFLVNIILCDWYLLLTQFSAIINDKSNMATKPGIKSKIPIKNPKKELSTETIEVNIRKSNAPKPLENKRNALKTEMCVKNKMSTAVKQSKGNAKKVITKGKAVPAENAPQQKTASKRVARSTIEKLSKEIGSHLKIEKFHDYNSGTESANVISQNTEGATTKRMIGEKKATSPSLMIQPKNFVPHSGVMLKPINKKTTVIINPFNLKPNPPKLRRSQSQYDPNFERPQTENIRLQRKDRNTAGNYKTDQKRKSPVLSKHKELSQGVENKQRIEIPVHSKNPPMPPKMLKHLSVENKSSKPLPLKSKSLKRSNTINAYSVPAVKKAIGIQKQQPINSMINTEKVKLDSESPVTPQNVELPLVADDDAEIHITPKKEVPHTGMVFKLAAKKGKEKICNAFSSVD